MLSHLAQDNNRTVATPRNERNPLQGTQSGNLSRSFPPSSPFLSPPPYHFQAPKGSTISTEKGLQQGAHSRFCKRPKGHLVFTHRPTNVHAYTHTQLPTSERQACASSECTRQICAPLRAEPLSSMRNTATSVSESFLFVLTRSKLCTVQLVFSLKPCHTTKLSMGLGSWTAWLAGEGSRL